MKKANLRILSLLLILCMGLCACRNNTPDPETSTPTADAPGESQTYTVTVADKAGNPVENVGVFVYEDETKAELVWFARTDAQGKVSFTHEASATLIAVLSELPEGYTAEEQYAITGTDTTIILGGSAVGEAAWKLGSNMPDFTITDCDGNTYTLSQLLEEKEAVVLNFWYIGCEPCRLEFPYLQEAYDLYSDRIALIAVNPVNQDNDAIARYKAENGLTFPMAAVPPEWEQLMGIMGYPTTVIIDRNGVISLIHYGAIPDTKTIADAMEYFVSEEYVPGVVENIEDLAKPEDVVHLGTPDDPLEFPGLLNFELEIPAGQETYFVLTKLQTMYLQVKDPDVYIIYNGKQYPASGGVAGTTVSAPDLFTPVVIGVGNPTEEDKTVQVSLSIPGGTISNPYTMKLGETTVKLASGNDQGVCYKFVAPADGEFTVSCLSVTPSKVDYDISLFNAASGAMRSLQADGGKDANGKPCVTVKMKKGQEVTITVMTLPDTARNYPAATIVVKSTFVESAGGPEEETKLVNYAITVTDSDRKPIPNVAFQIQNGLNTIRIATDANGIARIQLPAGTYAAKLIVPVGYRAGATQYTLSEKVPMFAIKLDRDVVVTAKYTVKVQDEAGKPLSNVMVAVGTAFGYTDANGSVVFNLPKGNYTAQISVPEGYDNSVASFPFANGATSLTITLKASGSGSGDPLPGQITYTITVQDYNGNPCKTAVVQLLQNGNLAGMLPVNSKGVASINLKPGTYTVQLSFSGDTLYYKETVVTADKPSASISVAGALTTKPITDYYFGTTYPVPAGGSYVKLQADAVNYFIFTAKTPGLYRFTTSDPKAKISFWGRNTNYVFDQSSFVNLENNAFTVNIPENELEHPVIIGVTGADSCILEITRLSDPIIDGPEIEKVEYKAKTPPKPFTYQAQSGKKLVRVDLTAKTSAYTLVYNETDKRYHVGSKTGPVVYVNLGPDAPYVSMYDMLGLSGVGGTSLRKTFVDANGQPIREENYTNCMIEYVQCADSKTGMYPLTEDLIYMLKNGGEGKHWWDKNDPNYLFGSIALNPEIAWMFACYIEQ